MPDGDRREDVDDRSDDTGLNTGGGDGEVSSRVFDDEATGLTVVSEIT